MCQHKWHNPKMAKKQHINNPTKKALLILSPDSFCHELEMRIQSGRKLLDIQVQRAYPSNLSRFGDYYSRRPVAPEYEKQQFAFFESEFNKWNDYNKELLKQSFDIPNNEYLQKYSSAGQITIITGSEDWLEVYHDEIKGKINNLECLIEKLNLLPVAETIENNSIDTKPTGKSPMIFISHASADKIFVEALVHLLEAIGFDESNLFCSSIPEYGIALGDNIYEKLLNLFREKELHVIFIHSPRYYTRPICLNEMGAAWVLKTEYYSILTNDMTFDMMNGVVSSHCVGIKVDAEDAPARLNELLDKLRDKFSLHPVSQTKWERLRNEFLSKVNAIQNPQSN